MLASLAPGSFATLTILAICFVLVLVFEFSNGFHDTANAVATVIYTNSLRPMVAVVWSGLMNFIGVLIGGIAVAYALVELIPPQVLTPPNGGVAAAMLVAVFAAALVWNVGTWWLGLPNSSSHALIGSLIGIALEVSLVPGVSFSHGTNDGQKSIGLIMLTIIGLTPASYALNLNMTGQQIQDTAAKMPDAAELIARSGAERSAQGAAAAKELGARLANVKAIADIPPDQRAALRNDLNETLASLRDVTENRSKAASDADKKSAKDIHDHLMRTVQYAPWWVRVLSALCLGLGTMIGYRRIVKTLGERLGKSHLVPAQGASAELVAAGLIGFAGFSGYPVSTTHVVTGGIAGTMVGSGAGVQKATLWRIAAAWLLTLPATIAISCAVFFILS